MILMKLTIIALLPDIHHHLSKTLSGEHAADLYGRLYPFDFHCFITATAAAQLNFEKEQFGKLIERKLKITKSQL